VLRFQIIKILQFTTFLLLVGRAWQHLFWGAPYAHLLPLEEGFSQWFVDKITMFFGWLFALGALFSFTLDSRDSKWGTFFIYLSFSLLLLAQLYRAENHNEWPTLLLYASQIATPLLYYQVQFTKVSLSKTMFLLKFSITLTLLGYAWYAFGFHYGIKSEWIEGISFLFALEKKTSIWLIYGLGIFEILLVLILWVKPLQKIGLAGIVFWGMLLMFASVLLFWIEHPVWISGIRSAWELLCLVPNAGLCFSFWHYINEKNKEEDF